MKVEFQLNGKQVQTEIQADTLLLDVVRNLGCYSVKRGCETANCGLCTVLLDGIPVLSCSVLAARAEGHTVTTLEGLEQEAQEFGLFLAREGGEQCGYCSQDLSSPSWQWKKNWKIQVKKKSMSIWQETYADAAAICRSFGQLKRT